MTMKSLPSPCILLNWICMAKAYRSGLVLQRRRRVFVVCGGRKNLGTQLIGDRFASAHDGEAVAVDEHFGWSVAAVVVRALHEPVSAGAANRKQRPFGQRQFALVREEVAGF